MSVETNPATTKSETTVQLDLKPEVRQESEVTPSINDGEIESEEELLFPGFVPKAFTCIPQTNFIRLWCLRTITWPYPFYKVQILQIYHFYDQYFLVLYISN